MSSVGGGPRDAGRRAVAATSARPHVQDGRVPGRRRRPPTDPANALLSLGYVILGNEIGALLEARGFDPAVGFVHGVRYGRQSLALDVVEAFRQPIVDRLTLRLLNLRQIQPGDFEGGEKGTRLLPEALKRYLAHYDAQMRAESEGAGTPTWRERLREQGEALAAMVMTGNVSPLYTWSDRGGSAEPAALTSPETENPGGLARGTESVDDVVDSRGYDLNAETAVASAAGSRSEEEGG